MLKPLGITESALYVDDLERAVRFYTSLFGSPVLRRDERFAALEINAQQVLLLFLRGGSRQPSIIDGGTIPAHDGVGPLHVCFGMGDDEVSAWKQQLSGLGIALESRVNWPNGTVSLYFRDPDGHAVELATPGLWRTS